MTEQRFSLTLSMTACFLAIEAGACAVCVVAMVLDSGPLAALWGVKLWAVAQPIILLVAIVCMPIGALLRWILGLTYKNPRPVALVTGAIIGLIGSAFFAASTKDGWSVFPTFISIGLPSGLVGGWVWWRLEKPFLDRA